MLLKPKDQKKRGKNPRSPHYKTKASKLWGAYMHLAKRACLVCGTTEQPLEAHHLIPKRRDATRNDPENGVMLCPKHHRGSVFCSPHAGPLGFKIFLKKNYPEKSRWIGNNRSTIGRADYKADCELLQELIDTFN